MEHGRELERYRCMRRGLRRQVLWGRSVFLAIIAVTLINQLLLWMGVDYHFLFSAALPYYLNWMAGQLNSTAFRLIATAVSLGLYVLYIGCWFCFQRREWLRGALILYAVDTVALIVFALTLLSNPLSCLLELLAHILAVVMLLPSYQASLRLSQLSQRPLPD